MKITITEKGLDIHRRLGLYNSQAQRPFGIKSKKPLTAMGEIKNDPNEVLSELLSAVISIHPPQEITVKSKRVPISETFKARYTSPLTSIFQNANPKKGFYSPRRKSINESILNLKGISLKAPYTNYNKAPLGKTSQTKLIEYTANNFIATTLKSNKVKELQLEEMKKRNEMELQRQAYIAREKMRINYLLDDKIKVLEVGNLYEPLSARLEGNRTRYTQRIERIHNSVKDQWQKKQRTVKLSRHNERRSRAPYYELINS